MRRFVTLVAPLVATFVLAGCHVLAPAASAENRSGKVLPLVRVRLYQTGVGYFERTGRLDEGDGTVLPVPTSHLDDALKTMVVWRRGEEPVMGIEFTSTMTNGVARALVGLPADESAPMSRFQLLRALRGERVEVRVGKQVIHGRVVNVVPAKGQGEQEDDGHDQDANDSDATHSKRSPERLLLLTDQGGLVRFDLPEVRSIRPTDPGVLRRLRIALDSLSPRAAQRSKQIRLAAEGDSPVTIGYVTEVPVWRTTYRIALSQAGKSVLQGWALIHNDTDEDWRGVRVELVNGKPDSFLFPLAAPRYASRELLTPKAPLSTVPQLLHRTADGMWGDFAEDDMYGSGGLAMRVGGAGGGGYGAGYGRGAGARPRVRLGSASIDSASDQLGVGNLASVRTKPGEERGVFFSYQLASPVTLRAHGSVLAPFVSGEIEASPATWIDDDGVARAAAEVVNSTKQTLPSGPVSFFSKGNFLGESFLPRMLPRQRAFVSYGVDLDLQAQRDKKRTEEKTKKVLLVESNTLEEHYLRTEWWDYELYNSSGEQRTVAWPVDVVSNARITGCDRVTFDDTGVGDGKPVLIFRVPARSHKTFHVKVVQGLKRTDNPIYMEMDKLEALARATDLAPATRAVLQRALEARKLVQQTENRLSFLETQEVELKRRLKSYRADLATISSGKAAPSPTHPFVRRIIETEAALQRVKQERKQLARSRDEQRTSVERALIPLRSSSH